jgi:3-methyladenine DNA glycosylase AlkD
MPNNLQNLKEQMRSLGSAKKAANSARFFKTGPGQYGQGDIFLGLTLPQQRSLAKQFPHLTLKEIQDLLDSPEHEFRLTALLILVARYHAADEPDQKKLHHFYLKNTHRINNWDLVDVSAEHLVGHHLSGRDKALLTKLAGSPLLWERRIAMVSCLHDIKQAKPLDALAIAQILLNDKHDLIHKAVGWMLREVGKRASRPALIDFLDKHHKTMPRTALRYALEHFKQADRKHYMTRTGGTAGTAGTASAGILPAPIRKTPSKG